MIAIGGKTKWTGAVPVVMGNRQCGLGSIQTLFTCVNEMVDKCIRSGMQCKYFMGDGLCLFTYVHAHL